MQNKYKNRVISNFNIKNKNIKDITDQKQILSP